MQLQHGSLPSVNLSPGDWLRRWYSHSGNGWRCDSEGPFSAPSNQGPPHNRPRPETRTGGRSSIDVTTPNTETAPGSADRLVHGHLDTTPTAHEEEREEISQKLAGRRSSPRWKNAIKLRVPQGLHAKQQKLLAHKRQAQHLLAGNCWLKANDPRDQLQWVPTHACQQFLQM